MSTTFIIARPIFTNVESFFEMYTTFIIARPIFTNVESFWNVYELYYSKAHIY